MQNKLLAKILLICTFLLSICLIINGIILSVNKSTVLEKHEDIPVFSEDKEDEYEYMNCINKSYVSNNTKEKIEELLNEYSSENIGIYFSDINNQYNIIKNEYDSYYGASLIKLLDATYLLRKAINSEIDLGTKLTYQIYHISDYSLGMESYSVGDEVPIKELIKYAISYSDNTAHEMLFEYIGINNLKEYASSLDIKLTIDEEEHFGHLNVFSTNKMLEEANDIIMNNEKYGNLLKVAMDNDYYNSLNFENTRFLHKYGYYATAYNDIGIYNTENPYLISIMTNYGYEDYENKVKEISQKIHNIYLDNLNDKENYCQSLKI